MDVVSSPLRFGAFELDPATGELRKNGLKIRLQQQPLEVLAMLLERPGAVVTREEMQRKLWSNDTFVDFDHSLNAAVKRLREALGDSAETPRFVETLPRLGYRFIAPIQEPAKREFTPPAAMRNVPIWPIVIAAALFVLTGVTASYFWWRHARSAPAHRKVMLAVLPLKNLSSPDQNYFAEGMTEELTTQLGRLQPEQLSVIARTSSDQYKNTGKSIAEIGKELGVDYVLEGSARNEAGRVRISVQLIDVRSQSHIWADEYDRDFRGILALQANVAGDVSRVIQIKLTPQAQAALTTQLLVNPKAHEDYLRGRYYWGQLSCEAFAKARDSFQKPVEKAPDFAPSYAGLADSFFKLADFGCVTDQRKAIAQAKAAALKALELDDKLGEAHASLAVLLCLYERQWSASDQEFKRALQLNPNYPSAHVWYAMYLLAMHRNSEAFTEMQKARELDPVSLFTNVLWGVMLYLSRQYGPAADQLRKTVELYPASPLPHGFLQLVYEQQGDYGAAFAEFLMVEASAGRSASALRGYRNAFARGGMHLVRQRYVQEELKRLKDPKAEPCTLGLGTYAMAGDIETVVQCAEQAYRDQDWDQLLEFIMGPVSDSVRSDPRFQQLVRQMGLPP